MIDLNPADMASPILQEEGKLAELHTQLTDLDIQQYRANEAHKQKLDNFAAEKEDWYKRINLIAQPFRNLPAGQKLLSPFSFSQDNIAVTLGTGDDDKSIVNAWETATKERIDGLISHNAQESADRWKQRKDILKSIEDIVGYDSDGESHTVGIQDQTAIRDTESANLASADKITFLEQELANTKKKLEQVQGANDSLKLEIRSVREELENVEEGKDNLVSVQSKLTEANTKLAALWFQLENKNHPNDDIRNLAIAASVRFFNLSRRRNNLGRFTAITDRGVTDVDAIDRGSAAVHSGNARAHAYMIFRDFGGEFKQYRALFKILYGVTYGEVVNGRGNKYRRTSKNTNIVNLRGSMAHCLSFTELTHDRIGDRRFESLRKQCETFFQEFLTTSGSAALAQDAFDKDPRVEAMCVEMRRIEKHTGWMERQRIKGRVSESESGSSVTS